jgi:hypothetical protein
MEPAGFAVDIVALCSAASWLAWRAARHRRERRHRRALRLLRVSGLLAANGQADLAAGYAKDALACAHRADDAACEALARETLGDIAFMQGELQHALHHWRHAALSLHLLRCRGDAARVCDKLAESLDAAGAPGAARWRRRAALAGLAVIDEDGNCPGIRRSAASPVRP